MHTYGSFHLQIRPDLGRIEKWVLRNAFDDDQKPYLPKVGKSAFKTFLPSSKFTGDLSFYLVLFPLNIFLQCRNVPI